MMMICSAKLDRCVGPMVTRNSSRTPVSHLPLVPELKGGLTKNRSRGVNRPGGMPTAKRVGPD